MGNVGRHYFRWRYELPFADGRQALITAPVRDARVSSPLVVQGLERGFAFEARVGVRLRTSGGRLSTPEEVLTYPGREADWGARVRLLSLIIRDGVATADFSREMRAYGGGSARVAAIRQQIASTLLQFPSVREVRIAIEGRTEGVLEP